MIGEIVEEFRSGFHSGLGDSGATLLPVDDKVGSEAECIPVRLGDTEQFADHVHREFSCEVVHELAAPLFDKGIDVGVGEIPDVGFEFADASRGKTARDQGPDSPVGRWIHREKGHHGARFAHVPFQGDALGVGKENRVAKSREDIRVARESPEISLLAVVDGGLFSQASIDGIGILVGLPVVGIEFDQGDGLHE